MSYETTMNMGTDVPYDPLSTNINNKKNLPRKAPKRESLHILLTNKVSSNNRKLLEFFENCLDELVQSGQVFKWTIVYPEEREEYREQGIDKFPVLLLDDEQVIGADNIIDYIMPEPEEDIAPSKKVGQNENGEYDVHKYMTDELQLPKNDDGKFINNGVDDEEDENDKFSRTLFQRARDMDEIRRKSGQHSSKQKNPDVQEKFTKPSTNSRIPMKKATTRKDNVQPTNAIPTVQDTYAKTKRRGGGGEDELMDLFMNKMETTD
jgi:hypothetical protein